MISTRARTAPGVRSRALHYGVDAPYIPAGFAFVAVLICFAALVDSGANGLAEAAVVWACGLVTALAGLGYLYTSLRGKLRWWAKLLDHLALKGDERVLDLGCGRGAVLVAVAQRLTTGAAHGVDVWRSQDLSGNRMEAAERNLHAAGVAERVQLEVGDLRALPYADASFDVVVSGLAFRHLKSRAARRAASDEAVRVLKPGGRLVLVDTHATRELASSLVGAGMLSVQRRSLGVRGWWGTPFLTTSVVTATARSSRPVPRPGTPSA